MPSPPLSDRRRARIIPLVALCPPLVLTRQLSPPYHLSSFPLDLGAFVHPLLRLLLPLLWPPSVLPPLPYTGLDFLLSLVCLDLLLDLLPSGRWSPPTPPLALTYLCGPQLHLSLARHFLHSSWVHAFFCATGHVRGMATARPCTPDRTLSCPLLTYLWATDFDSHRTPVRVVPYSLIWSGRPNYPSSNLVLANVHWTQHPDWNLGDCRISRSAAGLCGFLGLASPSTDVPPKHRLVGISPPIPPLSETVVYHIGKSRYPK